MAYARVELDDENKTRREKFHNLPNGETEVVSDECRRQWMEGIIE